MLEAIRRFLPGSDASPYETKTVRFHLPDRGQYLYVTITRFDGEETILAEIGYRGEYFQFQTMSGNNAARQGNTDLYALGDAHPWEGFMDSYPADLLYAIDMGRLPWDAIDDGDHLTEADVETLLEASHA